MGVCQAGTRFSLSSRGIVWSEARVGSHFCPPDPESTQNRLSFALEQHFTFSDRIHQFITNIYAVVRDTIMPKVQPYYWKPLLMGPRRVPLGTEERAAELQPSTSRQFGKQHLTLATATVTVTSSMEHIESSVPITNDSKSQSQKSAVIM